MAASSARAERVSLQEKLEFLRRPASYPDAPGWVEVKETHMSWVFLTRRLVYKMKKPVKLPYLDFSALEARHHFCRESLRLNRRLAACLEFSRPLRIVDPVDELAYLALECERLGADLNRLFFDAYQQATADAPPARLVSFYKVHRAMNRAKLAVWHLADHADRDKWIGRAEAYLRLALDHAEGL